ncbi:MAG: hypothetical protein HY040_23560 [Planctomycetes bacterium]|nr:hypothetical protein [Planctomycetota bacterium]
MILAEVAQEKKTAFCDIREAFAEFSSEQLDEMLLPYPDHLHLSVKGNAHYAKLIFPFVKEAIEKVLEKTEPDDQC